MSSEENPNYDLGPSATSVQHELSEMNPNSVLDSMWSLSAISVQHYGRPTKAKSVQRFVRVANATSVQNSVREVHAIAAIQHGSMAARKKPVPAPVSGGSQYAKVQVESSSVAIDLANCYGSVLNWVQS